MKIQVVCNGESVKVVGVDVLDGLLTWKPMMAQIAIGIVNDPAKWTSAARGRLQPVFHQFFKPNLTQEEMDILAALNGCQGVEESRLRDRFTNFDASIKNLNHLGLVYWSEGRFFVFV